MARGVPAHAASGRSRASAATTRRDKLYLPRAVVRRHRVRVHIRRGRMSDIASRDASVTVAGSPARIPPSSASSSSVVEPETLSTIESTPQPARIGSAEVLHGYSAAGRRTRPLHETAAADWLRHMFAVPTDAHAIAALDGVRALAASLVFLVHYQAAFGYLLGAHPPLYRAGEYMAALGYHGVNIFFVLSGFLIYGSLVARPVTPSRYLRRRIRRIYPTFLVVLGIYLVLSVLVPDRSKLPSGGNALLYVAANALLLPGVFPIRPVVTVSWSLSFEVCFYILILAVVAGLGMRRWTPRARLVLWAGSVIAWAVGGARTQAFVGSFILFVPGIMLAEAARSDSLRLKVSRVPVWLAVLFFAVVVAAQPVLVKDLPTGGQAQFAFLGPGVIALLLLATATSLLLFRLLVAPRATTIFAREPVRRLGVVSYSFYLSHGLAINAVGALCARPSVDHVLHPLGVAAYVLLFPVVFGAAVLTSFVLFRAVEQPLSLTPS